MAYLNVMMASQAVAARALGRALCVSLCALWLQGSDMRDVHFQSWVAVQLW